MGLRTALVELYYAALRARVPTPRNALATTLDAVQLRDSLRDLRIDCVLDVGANTGQFVRRLRRLGYRGWIISFEPSSEAFQQMSAERAGDPLWRGYPYALGETDGTKAFHVNAESKCSSFLRGRNAPAVRVDHVEVRRIDSILPDLIRSLPNCPSTPRIFLKMDTQGYDTQVLAGAKGSLSQIVALLSEVSIVPLYEDMVPYYKALEIYAGLGFDILSLSEVTRTVDGRVCEYDCLMVRRDAL
jgi:FkbM family methyltransferase